jgi:hypothetical protein
LEKQKYSKCGGIEMEKTKQKPFVKILENELGNIHHALYEMKNSHWNENGSVESLEHANEQLSIIFQFFEDHPAASKTIKCSNCDEEFQIEIAFPPINLGNEIVNVSDVGIGITCPNCKAHWNKYIIFPKKGQKFDPKKGQKKLC